QQPTPIYTLSLHDALPILGRLAAAGFFGGSVAVSGAFRGTGAGSIPSALAVASWTTPPACVMVAPRVISSSKLRTSSPEGTRCLDRKSTRLNSSHVSISYA